jgi:competence protein ComEA
VTVSVFALLSIASMRFTARVEAQAAPFPENPGREIFEIICSSCHQPTVVLDKRWTKAAWQTKVTEMLQEEVDVTETERTQIVDYLSKSFPDRVNVNTATAAELERIAQLPGDSASAIVAHRAAKGTFKTIEDVKQVPGVDAVRLEERKDRLEF